MGRITFGCPCRDMKGAVGKALMGTGSMDGSIWDYWCCSFHSMVMVACVL